MFGGSSTVADRENKGRCITHHIDDYCVLDLETTSKFIKWTSIIEIAAIKVRNNEVVDEFSCLVNPMCHIPKDATDINHITDDMVAGCPVIDDVLDDLLNFVGDDVIVGYNNAGFDMNIIYDRCFDLKGIYFSNNYIDVLHSAQKCLRELENRKLETVCKYYNLDTEGEHRALKDCYLTKKCYDRIYEDYGNFAFERGESKGYGQSKITSETRALQELQLLLEGIICDGQVSEEEFDFLRDWVEEHFDLRGIYPFDRVFNALDNVLADGSVSKEEREELHMLFSKFVDPVACQSSQETIESLTDIHICVTGDFAYGSRDKVFALIEKLGGINDKNVKKCTQYVVVGEKGSDSWKTGNYGGKILKAMELNDKGCNIHIIEEKDFFASIKTLIDNMDS